MRSSAVARNYAATLFDLAARDGSEAVYADLIEAAGGLYATSEEFRRFLDSPAISPAERKQAVAAALEGRAPALFSRFMMLLIDRHRQSSLRGIAGAYRDLLDRKTGRLRASVTLAIDVDEDARAEITEALERRWAKTIIPEFHTDPAVLGGLIVRVGDELFDASLRRRLEDLRQGLRGGATGRA